MLLAAPVAGSLPPGSGVPGPPDGRPLSSASPSAVGSTVGHSSSLPATAFGAAGRTVPSLEQGSPRSRPGTEASGFAPRIGAGSDALGSFSTGSVTGKVVDLTTHRPIGGVSVTAISLIGAICPNCNSTSTTTTGDFTLAAAVGPTELTYTNASGHLDNESWTTVPNGTTVSVGTIYLVHVAYATGIVESDVPGHPALGQVQFAAASRDGTIYFQLGSPSTADGTFNVSIPPVPSILTFYPGSNQSSPPRFVTNWTYTNATPNSTLDLGAVYLEGGVSVHAELWDRLSNTVVPSSVSTQITVCSDRGPTCLPPVNGTMGGGSVPGWGIPGPAYVTASAVGYVVNQTWVTDIPNTNGSVDLGRIYLLRAGGVELTANLTGGTPSKLGWAAGTKINVAICSLDGLRVVPGGNESILGGSVCLEYRGLGLDQTVVLPAAPLRDVVILNESSGFPIALLPLTSPPLPWPNLDGNMTWVNVTPGQVAVLGSVDLTAGTYVAGNISIDGATSNLTGRFTVSACSTEEAGECGWPGTSGTPAGCPTASNSFCVPAPPGPVEVTVTTFANLTTPSASNRTWLTLPTGCCAQDGHPTWVGLTSTINVTTRSDGGIVSGRVDRAGSAGSPAAPLTGVLAAVETCGVAAPAGSESGACEGGTVDPLTGQFSVDAPAGWDQVTVSATGFDSNATWVFVNGTNSTGTIDLVPKAVVYGTVADPVGHGITDAYVRVCAVADADLCPATSGSPTNTAGQFNLTVSGGPFPRGTYEVYVSGSGYSSNWTWVNTTSGNLANAGTLTLTPTVGARPPTRVTVGPAGTVWIWGRVVDGRTGFGIPEVTVEACPVPGTSCSLTAATVPLGGEFNFSLARGTYDLNLTAPNYSPRLVYVNATGNALDVGTVSLAPFAWVQGRVAISPWGGLEGTVGLGAGGATVDACDSSGPACGTSVITATDGSFNVSSPFSDPVDLTVFGGGPGYYGSGPWGFEPLGLSAAVQQNYTELSSVHGTPSSLAIFGELTGTLRDGQSWNATSALAPARAAFAVAQGWTYGAGGGYALTNSGADGTFTLLLPSNGNSTEVIGRGTAYLAANLTRPGSLAPGVVADVGEIVLTHFGWIQARTVDGTTGRPVSVPVTETASRSDPANATTLVGYGDASQFGLLNVTAPPGSAVTLTVQAAGYANATVTTAVYPGETTGVGTIRLSPSSAQAPAWLESAQVNPGGNAPVPTVVDSVTREPLLFVVVHTTTPTGAHLADVLTNGLGQFLASVPPGNPDTVQWSLPDFQPFSAGYNVTGGSRTVVDRVNLTGDAVLAGRIIESPGGAPVAGLQVEGCALSGPCASVAYTNGLGEFWIAVAPGYAEVKVSTDQYLANVTRSATVGSDSWTWLGDIPVYQFASILGVVRALPSGLPLANATVSLCSALFAPWGPCGASVPTDKNGTFQVEYPPGEFVLVVSARFYNTTYFPLSLAAGSQVWLGTIFLLEWGGVEGSVGSLLDHGPIANVTVQACAAWSGTDCSPVAETNASGGYLLLAPPGPVVLTARAVGYEDGVAKLTVSAGGLVMAPPILLVPSAPEVLESLSGTVVTGPTAVPVPDAFVALEEGGRSVAATSSGPVGTFEVRAYWGTYNLTVLAPGFGAFTAPLVLHDNLSGEVVTLAPFAFALSGQVRGADSGEGLGGVAIELGSAVLGTSSSQGNFQVDLANGTYALVAAPPSGLAYLPLTFSVTIAGSDVARTLALLPAGALLGGIVVDASSGLPVPFAAVGVTGPGIAVVGHAEAVTASDVGAFSFYLPPGSYLMNVSAPGYLPTSETVVVGNGSPPVIVALEPVGSLAGAGPPLLLLAFGAGTVLAIFAGALYLRRQSGVRGRSRRGSETDPAGSTGDETEPGAT